MNLNSPSICLALNVAIRAEEDRGNGHHNHVRDWREALSALSPLKTVELPLPVAVNRPLPLAPGPVRYDPFPNDPRFVECDEYLTRPQSFLAPLHNVLRKWRG
jgi:hypothetical protein